MIKIEADYQKTHNNYNEWLINGKKVKLFRITSKQSLESYFNEIYNRMINKLTMTDLQEELGIRTIAIISIEFFSELTEEYLIYHAKQFTKSKYHISARQLYKKLYIDYKPHQLENYAPKFYKLVELIVDKEQNYQKTCGNKFFDITEQIYVEKYKDKVKVIMENRQTMTDLIKELGVSPIANISLEFYPELTKEYLMYFAKEITKKREVITGRNLALTVYGIDYYSLPLSRSKESRFKNLITLIVEEEYNCQLDKLPGSRLDVKQDVWKLFYVEGKILKGHTIDFSRIKKVGLRKEVKYFLFDRFTKGHPKNELQKNFSRILKGLGFIVQKYRQVEYCADISSKMVKSLVKFLETEAKTQFGKPLSIAQVSSIISHLGLLVSFLMDNETELKTKKPKTNLFRKISFHNIENLKERTEYIPEEVVNKMLYYIDDIPDKPYQRMLLIMLNCGLRFKEVKHLEEDCLRYDNENKVWVLKFIPWKVLESRRHRGLNDYHEIAVKDFIVEEINEQKKETKGLRLISGLKEIFIKESSYKKGIVDSGTFNRAINKLIKKHEIISNDGALWEFTSKQCRKTLAVDMITNGAQSHEVANQLGHSSNSTTERFYAEVRQMKLAQMNTKFFRKKFELSVSDEQLDKFSEEERRLLYVDFCLNQREVELGKCVKPIGEGSCSKRTGKTDCATCKYICTGEQALPKWEAMRDSQRKIKEELERIYKEQNISDYHEYREYQRAVYLFKIYQDTIDKIEQQAERRVIR